VVHTAASGLPLGTERDERHFKALFRDIGRVNRRCGLTLVGAEDLITVNAGALGEQFLGQQPWGGKLRPGADQLMQKRFCRHPVSGKLTEPA